MKLPCYRLGIMLFLSTLAPWQPHDPWTYAMRFTNYYVKMKAADPTIKIGAVADTTEDGTGGDKQCVSLTGGLFCADSIGQILQTEFNSRLWWDFRNGSGTLGDPDPEFYGWRTNSDGSILVDGGIVYGLGGGGSAYPTYDVAKLMPYFAADGDTVVSATGHYPLLAVYSVKRTNGNLTLQVGQTRSPIRFQAQQQTSRNPSLDRSSSGVACSSREPLDPD